MPIVITIPDEHPHYRALLARLESVSSKSAGFVSIEQLEDGTWCARSMYCSPRPNEPRFNPYVVQIAEEKPLISRA